MSQVCSIFSQLLKLFPRAEFEQAVRQHRGERHARGFTCWGQFVAMLFCQLGRAQSLREICGGLAASQGKPRHLGLFRRSAALDAGLRQPATPLADLRNRLSAAAGEVPRRGAGPQVPFQKQAAESGRQRPSTCAPRCSIGPSSGAPKAPSSCIWCSTTTAICPASASSPTARRPTWRRPARCCSTPARIVVFDRGYNDYDWFAELSERGVFFVTRLKRGADYEVLEQRPLPRRPAGVRRDEVIFFPSLAASGSEVVFRRHRILRRRAAAYAGVFDQSPGAGGCDDRRHLSRPLADRAVFQGPQAEPASEDLRGHLGERAEDPDLDGADRDFAAALPQAAGALGLELVQSGRFVAAAVVCAPRIVRLAGRTVSTRRRAANPSRRGNYY